MPSQIFVKNKRSKLTKLTKSFNWTDDNDIRTSADVVETFHSKLLRPNTSLPNHSLFSDAYRTSWLSIALHRLNIIH